MRRSTPAPTWSASCSFRRARAISALEAARALGEQRARPRRQGRALGRCRRRRCSTSSRRSSPTCCNCTARRRRSAWSRCAARFGLPVMKALPIAERADLVADPHLRQGRRPAALRRQAAARKRRGRAASAAVRLDAAARASIPACPSCCRAGSTPAMSPRRCASPRAPGVDVSSGVERAPGVKDPDKIRAFVARRARGRRAARSSAYRRREQRMTVQQPNSFRTGPDERGHFGILAAASSPRR